MTVTPSPSAPSDLALAAADQGLGSLVATPPVDGRRARRERNRDALIDAWLDTIFSGELEPSIATVAERSGVSYRSVFRYFDSIHELFAVGLERGRENTEHLAVLENPGEGPLDVRIERFVDQRTAYFEALGPLGRATRMHAPVRPELEAQLVEMRKLLRHQTEAHFAPELDGLDEAEAMSIRTAIDSLCSFESWDLMRSIDTLGIPEASEALRQALVRLLG